MRRMGAAGHIVAEERLVRRDRVELIQPGDGSGGHCGGQVPARLADIGIDRCGVSEEVGLPLAGVAADEAVEILESHAGRPLVEGPRLARLERGCVVTLPNHDVAVLGPVGQERQRPMPPATE